MSASIINITHRPEISPVMVTINLPDCEYEKEYTAKSLDVVFNKVLTEYPTVTSIVMVFTVQST